MILEVLAPVLAEIILGSGLMSMRAVVRLCGERTFCVACYTCCIQMVEGEKVEAEGEVEVDGDIHLFARLHIGSFVHPLWWPSACLLDHVKGNIL
jgi:hypothetical protein